LSTLLLDSDAVIDYLKGVESSVHFIRDLLSHGDTFATSAIVTCEVWAGLYPSERAVGEQLLTSMVYLETSRKAARLAGEWRFAYARQGVQISSTDALIASTANEHGAGIVTANLRHFPMPELTLVPLPRIANL
jgi:predicted nucleic acid-binding protein